MTRAGLRLTGLVVVVYLVGLLTLFPASLAVRWFVPDMPGLALGPTEGTIWRGRIDSVEYLEWPGGQASWKLNPLALLSLRANADIELRRHQGNTISAYVSARPDGSADIRSLRGTLTLRDLEQLRIVPRNVASGELLINMDRLQLHDGRLLAAEGRLALTDLRTPLLPNEPLGSYSAEVTTEDNAVVARYSQLEAPLEVSGDARVHPDGRYTVAGSILPTRETPEMIRRGLGFMGSPDSSGRYPFRFEGSY